MPNHCNRVNNLLLFYFVFFVFTTNSAQGIQWLSLKADDVVGLSDGSTEDTVSDEGVGCGRARSLGVKPCAALIHVARAASLAKTTCKLFHSHRRWNCSSIDLAPDFTPELLLGTREQSFVYALSTAALTYTMARACSSGALFSCTCGLPPRVLPAGNFQWGGCSDNLKWAGRFVRQFIEIQEKSKGEHKHNEPANSSHSDATEKITKHVDAKDSKDTAVNQSFHHVPHEMATLVKRDVLLQTHVDNTKRRRKVLNKITLEKRLKKLQHFLQIANLQNSKAGRKVMENTMSIQCKCHGVSGSCSIRTCWRSLSPMLKVAEKLWEAAERSIKASVPKIRIRNQKRSANLLFVTESSNYCTQNPATGSIGTAGRSCNATSRAADGSCRYMCCGRGFKTIVNSTLERCNCRYVWCCKVECDVCKTTTETHYCK